MDLASAPTLRAEGAASPAEALGRGLERAALGLILLGLVLLYAPVGAEFGSQFLLEQDDSHAGFLLGLVCWAYWSDRAALRWTATATEIGAGAGVVSSGLIIYLLGRITNLVQLQALSLSVIATGLILAIGGTALVRRWWLPSLLLIFIVPWLGSGADVLLVPMCLGLTHAAVDFANLLGISAGATGVMIDVGFVRLGLYGACVGPRSMVSLVAIGVLFLHFFPPRSVWSGLLFIATLLPIALTANFLRICYLIITAGVFGASGEAALDDGAAYAEVIVAITAFALLGKAMTRQQSAV